ncbi:MAG: hypothetical protein ACJAS1_007463 [Oleiphilaceae bacterium]
MRTQSIHKQSNKYIIKFKHYVADDNVGKRSQ